MADERIELPYRVQKWPTICVSLLMVLGMVGGTALGFYLFGGGEFGVQQGLGALVRGKSGAAVMWSVAGLSCAVELLVIISWSAIARRKPKVVLEADAVTVPSKWRMQPVRIEIATLTSVSRKVFGQVGYLWLHYKGGKAVIVENMLETGDAQLIVNWIASRRAALGRPEGDL